jgi:hypothetical protein
MFRLHAVNAFFGDALLLEYGTATDPRFLLVDGGPPDTYSRHLSTVLREVTQRGCDLDLAILSHVDNDHVVGLLEFVAELRAGVAGLPAVGALWHNSFGDALDPGGTLAPRLRAMTAGHGAHAIPQAAMSANGIGEGNQLRVQALAHGIPLNPGFAGNLITVEHAGAPWRSANLDLTIVGPTQANLDALRDEWEDWLDDHEGETDPLVLANSDRSIPNLSSIMCLARADGRTLLLTGDGRSDHLLDGLEAAGLLDAHGNLHVDVLKLPHHGSDRNVTKTFFRKVTADTYVASADGKHDNPDLATLIWIVEAAEAEDRPIRLVVTNATPSTRKLVEEYSPQDYGYDLDVRDPGRNAVVVDLA